MVTARLNDAFNSSNEVDNQIFSSIRWREMRWDEMSLKFFRYLKNLQQIIFDEGVFMIWDAVLMNSKWLTLGKTKDLFQILKDKEDSQGSFKVSVCGLTLLPSFSRNFKPIGHRGQFNSGGFAKQCLLLIKEFPIVIDLKIFLKLLILINSLQSIGWMRKTNWLVTAVIEIIIIMNWEIWDIKGLREPCGVDVRQWLL